MLTTDSLTTFTPTGKSSDELSMDDILALLKNKTSKNLPPEIQYNEDDIKELEKFCESHGIINFNCGNMSPKAAIKILKSRMGIVDHTIANLESQCCKIVGKNYDHTKQLLNG
jgi:hypothetical protein